MEKKWNLQEVWQSVTIPARPCESDLCIIENHLKTLGRNSRALILGCTPEFRDLLMKYDVETTCADYNASSFHEFKNHMEHRDRSKLIEADWRAMVLGEKYDVILGDLAFTMLPLGDWEILAARLNGALSGNGRAFQRIWLSIPGRYADFDEIISEHKTARKGMHPFTSLSYPFFQHFVKKDYSFHPIEVTKIHLKKKYEEGFLTKDEFEFFDMFWGNFNTVMYFPTKEKAEGLLSGHLSIEAAHYCNHFFRDFAPLYVLGKRS